MATDGGDGAEESLCLEALWCLQLQVHRELVRHLSARRASGGRASRASAVKCAEPRLAGDEASRESGSADRRGGNGDAESDGDASSGGTPRRNSERRLTGICGGLSLSPNKGLGLRVRAGSSRGEGSESGESRSGDKEFALSPERMRRPETPASARREKAADRARFTASGSARSLSARGASAGCPNCRHLRRELYRQQVRRACVETESKELLQRLARRVRDARSHVRNVETARAEEQAALTRDLREKEKEVAGLKDLLARALQRGDEALAFLRSTQGVSSAKHAVRQKDVPAEKTCAVMGLAEAASEPSLPGPSTQQETSTRMPHAHFEARLLRLEQQLAEQQQQQSRKDWRASSQAQSAPGPVELTEGTAECESSARRRASGDIEVNVSEGHACLQKRRASSPEGPDGVAYTAPARGAVAGSPLQRAALRDPSAQAPCSPHGLTGAPDLSPASNVRRPGSAAPGVGRPSSAVVAAAQTALQGGAGQIEASPALLTVSSELQQQMLRQERSVVPSASETFFHLERSRPILACAPASWENAQGGHRGGAARVALWPSEGGDLQLVDEAALRTASTQGLHRESWCGAYTIRHSYSLLSQAGVARGQAPSRGASPRFSAAQSFTPRSVSGLSAGSPPHPAFFFASVAGGASSCTRGSPVARRLGGQTGAGTGEPHPPPLWGNFLLRGAASASDVPSQTRSRSMTDRSRGADCSGVPAAPQLGYLHQTLLGPSRRDLPFPEALAGPPHALGAEVPRQVSPESRLPDVSTACLFHCAMGSSRRAEGHRVAHEQQPQVALPEGVLSLSDQLRLHTVEIESLKTNAAGILCRPPEPRRASAGNDWLASARVAGDPFIHSECEVDKARKSQADPERIPAKATPVADAALPAGGPRPQLSSPPVSGVQAADPISYGAEAILHRRERRPAARELPDDAFLELSSMSSEAGEAICEGL